MNVIRHHDKTIYKVAVTFQDIEPVIDDIVTVYFLNQG
jgi:hypothetical protein